MDLLSQRSNYVWKSLRAVSLIPLSSFWKWRPLITLLYVTALNNLKQEQSVRKKVDHFYKSTGGISHRQRLLIANCCLFFDTVHDSHSPVLRQCAFLFSFFLKVHLREGWLLFVATSILLLSCEWERGTLSGSESSPRKCPVLERHGSTTPVSCHKLQYNARRPSILLYTFHEQHGGTMRLGLCIQRCSIAILILILRMVWLVSFTLCLSSSDSGTLAEKWDNAALINLQREML